MGLAGVMYFKNSITNLLIVVVGDLGTANDGRLGGTKFSPEVALSIIEVQANIGLGKTLVNGFQHPELSPS